MGAFRQLVQLVVRMPTFPNGERLVEKGIQTSQHGAREAAVQIRVINAADEGRRILLAADAALPKLGRFGQHGRGSELRQDLVRHTVAQLLEQLARALGAKVVISASEPECFDESCLRALQRMARSSFNIHAS